MPKSWSRPTQDPAGGLVALLGTFMLLLRRGFLALEVEGRERIPVAGPCLLVSNAVGRLESRVLRAAIRRPRVLELGPLNGQRPRVPRRESTLTSPSLCDWGNGVERGPEDVLRLIRAGWLVALPWYDPLEPDFPGAQHESAVADLALRSGVPVLPVAVARSGGILRDIMRGRRASVRVTVGVPFRPSRPETGQAPLRRLAVRRELTRRIASLRQGTGAPFPPLSSGRPASRTPL